MEFEIQHFVGPFSRRLTLADLLLDFLLLKVKLVNFFKENLFWRDGIWNLTYYSERRTSDEWTSKIDAI